MSEVTKPKNEGRVAAGKRLADWNRKNKENLLKNKEQVKSSGEPSAPTSAQEPSSSAPSVSARAATLYVAAVAAIGLVAWILWTQKKKTPAVQSRPPPPPKPAIDLVMF